MPLHCEHLGSALHLERLHHTVVGGTGHHHTLARPADSLMMQAVGGGLRSVQRVGGRAGLHANRVAPFDARRTPCGVGRRVEVLELAGREVTITNPDKVYFPQAGHTKLDLVRYYVAVAEGALRGAGGRPMALKRFVDGATGETKWTYRLDEGERGDRAPRINNRGLSYWTDGRGDERIILITAGYQMVGLNAKTGLPVPAFGKNGIVELWDGLDRNVQVNEIGSSSPAMIVGDDLGGLEEAAKDKTVAHEMTLNRLCVNLLTGN